MFLDAVLVASIVALVKNLFPTVQGNVTLLIAFVACVAVAMLVPLQAAFPASVMWLAPLIEVIKLFITAAGGVSLVKYFMK